MSFFAADVSCSAPLRNAGRREKTALNKDCSVCAAGPFPAAPPAPSGFSHARNLFAIRLVLQLGPFFDAGLDLLKGAETADRPRDSAVARCRAEAGRGSTSLVSRT